MDFFWGKLFSVLRCLGKFVRAILSCSGVANFFGTHYAGVKMGVPRWEWASQPYDHEGGRFRLKYPLTAAERQRMHRERLSPRERKWITSINNARRCRKRRCLEVRRRRTRKTRSVKVGAQVIYRKRSHNVVYARIVGGESWVVLKDAESGDEVPLPLSECK